MNMNGDVLRAIAMICLTVVAVMLIFAACTICCERERTKQAQAGSTNYTHMSFP